MILNYLTYHRRAAEEGKRLRSVGKRKLRDDKDVLGIMKTEAEVLREQGKKIGIEEGERIGIEKGMRRLVGDLVSQRFGALPERAERRLLSMDLAGLQALGLAVSPAYSLDDLWL